MHTWYQCVAVLNQFLGDYAVAKGNLVDYMWFLGDYAVFCVNCNQPLWTANHLEMLLCNQLELL